MLPPQSFGHHRAARTIAVGAAIKLTMVAL